MQRIIYRLIASDLQRSIDRGIKVNGYRRREEENPSGAPSDQDRRTTHLNSGNNIESLWSAVQRASLAAKRALAERFTLGDGVATNCDQARVLLEGSGKLGQREALLRLDELETRAAARTRGYSETPAKLKNQRRVRPAWIKDISTEFCVPVRVFKQAVV